MQTRTVSGLRRLSTFKHQGDGPAIMIVIDDRHIAGDSGGLVIVNRVGRREITHAVHDIDGTHSIIRQWPPVMSICLHYASHNPLDGDFDSDEILHWLVENAGKQALPETDRFCVESAGLSALTQMEWAIRRGLELGSVRIKDYTPTADDHRKNSYIVQEIWSGREMFGDVHEAPQISTYIAERVPRLFRLYENALNRFCRDRNLAEARRNPEPWRVPGSMNFLRLLHASSVKNYFLTGAVVDARDSGSITGIHEEVVVLGYSIGPGELVEDIVGSLWDKKITKIEAMMRLIDEVGIRKEDLLIVGDGRAEIQAASQLDAVAISRLEHDATCQRLIHTEAGTNYIVPDYTSEDFKSLFHHG